MRKKRLINHLKRARGIYIFVFSMIFNFATSLYFGHGSSLGFNEHPLSIAEYVCDIFSSIGQVISIYFIVNDSMFKMILIKKQLDKDREVVGHHMEVLIKVYDNLDLHLDKVECIIKNTKDKKE